VRLPYTKNIAAHFAVTFCQTGRLEDGTLQPKCRLAWKPLSVCRDMLTDATLETGALTVCMSCLEAPGAVPRSASFVLGPDSKGSRTALFCVITQRVVVIPYRRFGKPHWRHLQGSRLGSCPLKMCQIGCPETSIRNYHYLPRNGP